MATSERSDSAIPMNLVIAAEEQLCMAIVAKIQQHPGTSVHVHVVYIRLKRSRKAGLIHEENRNVARWRRPAVRERQTAVKHIILGAVPVQIGAIYLLKRNIANINDPWFFGSFSPQRDAAVVCRCHNTVESTPATLIEKAGADLGQRKTIQTRDVDASGRVVPICNQKGGG